MLRSCPVRGGHKSRGISLGGCRHVSKRFSHGLHFCRHDPDCTLACLLALADRRQDCCCSMLLFIVAQQRGEKQTTGSISMFQLRSSLSSSSSCCPVSWRVLFFVCSIGGRPSKHRWQPDLLDGGSMDNVGGSSSIKRNSRTNKGLGRPLLVDQPLPPADFPKDVKVGGPPFIVEPIVGDSFTGKSPSKLVDCCCTCNTGWLCANAAILEALAHCRRRLGTLTTQQPYRPGCLSTGVAMVGTAGLLRVYTCGLGAMACGIPRAPATSC